MIAIFLGFVAISASDRRALLVARGNTSLFATTCDNYRARARELPRAAPLEFVVLLAESCTAAERAMTNGTPPQKAAAALLLARLGQLQETIDGMNAERARAARLAMAGDQHSWAGMLDLPVSPTGEFLIAHRMGVMLAIDTLLDSGVNLPLASLR